MKPTRLCKGPWPVVALTQLTAVAKFRKSLQSTVNAKLAACTSQYNSKKIPALAHQAYRILNKVLPEPAISPFADPIMPLFKPPLAGSGRAAAIAMSEKTADAPKSAASACSQTDILRILEFLVSEPALQAILYHSLVGAHLCPSLHGHCQQVIEFRALSEKLRLLVVKQPPIYIQIHYQYYSELAVN